MEKLSQKVLRDYKNKPNWNVPLLFNNDRVARDLFNISKILYGIEPFKAMYGGFKCSWSGGRGSTREDILDLGYVPGVAELESIGIFPWIVFSRYNMSEEQLNDEGCWQIVKWLCSYRWGCIVSNDRLKDRIKEYDSKVLVKASVIKFVHEVGSKNLVEEADMYLDALNSGYDYIVPRPEFFVKGGADLIPEELRNRVEVLVNQFCAFECPSAIYHYNLIEDFEETGKWNNFECVGRKSLLDCGNNCVIDYDSLCKLNEMGYMNYKIQGRGLSPRCAIDQLAKYIYEPTGAIHILEEEILNRIKKEQREGIFNRF